MCNSPWSLYLSIFYQVNQFSSLHHKFGGYPLDPYRDCSWKKQTLGFFVCNLVNVMINFLYILLKTHLKHFVCLIKAEAFNAFEVDFASFEQIDQSSWSGDYNVNFFLEFVNMLIKLNPSINWDHVELFWRELERFDLICDLDTKLSCW